MTNFCDEPELTRQRQNVVRVARAMLDGQLGVIDGSRQLCALRSRVSPLDFDPNFLPFVGIDSETDHLPIGEVRQHWAADALATKDAELGDAEPQYREMALSGCHRLVERFSASTHRA